ncbi:MAG TPA: DNA replication and repair protein RecF [Polyangiaceae bacterium]|nr:DNA replication and repair protein RecF [Polyangiaceae bacterium]
MTQPLRFEQVEVTGFRNLQRALFKPVARLNVIAGDNGQGKTSLIEALYLVSTSKSFRTERSDEMICEGASDALTAAVLREGELTREQRALLGRGQRAFRLNGKRPKNLAFYATQTPVVVFHPGDLTLVAGAAQGRRTLLDRVALFFEPITADHRSRYTRALRARQRVLEERGVRAAELEALETIIAEHGAALSAARVRTAERLIEALHPAFEKMAAPGLALRAELLEKGTADRESFLAKLNAVRTDDLRRGRATFGPQRDDLELFVDGRSARGHASQGQQRVLTLALKLAELACLRQARRAHPILLLDDVSSELDPARTGAVYRLLEGSQSQVFVTTTRPELFTTPDLAPEERADFTLHAGALSRLS